MQNTTDPTVATAVAVVGVGVVAADPGLGPGGGVPDPGPGEGVTGPSLGQGAGETVPNLGPSPVATAQSLNHVSGRDPSLLQRIVDDATLAGPIDRTIELCR